MVFITPALHTYREMVMQIETTRIYPTVQAMEIATLTAKLTSMERQLEQLQREMRLIQRGIWGTLVLAALAVLLQLFR